MLKQTNDKKINNKNERKNLKSKKKNVNKKS